MPVYSFEDVSGVISNPAFGSYAIIGGNAGGNDKVSISMKTDRSKIAIAADGGSMISAIAGDNAEVSLEIQQVSLLHQFLLDGYNILLAQKKLRILSNWAATQFRLTSVLTQTRHSGSGGAFIKYPDISYGAEGAMVTWTLLFGRMTNQ